MEQKLSARWKAFRILSAVSLIGPVGIWLWFLYRMLFGAELASISPSAIAIFFIPPPVLVALFFAARSAFGRGRVAAGKGLTVATLLLSLLATIFYAVLLRALAVFN